MKIENLLFSIIIMVIAIAGLAICGWCLSFLFGFENTAELSDIRVFGVRVAIGLVMLGFMAGMSKMWDLFHFCMSESVSIKYKKDN